MRVLEHAARWLPGIIEVPLLAHEEDRDAMPNRASGNVRRNFGAGIIEVIPCGAR
jgi:hypothetical protein